MTSGSNKFAHQGNVNLLSEELEIFVSCRNLPKVEFSSPSDPFIVISQKIDSINIKNGSNVKICDRIRYQELAKTEEVQIIRLDVYDADTKNMSKLTYHDYIGYCEFVLGDLVSTQNSKLVIKIKNRKTQQPLFFKSYPVVCIVRCETTSPSDAWVDLQFAGNHLPKMDWGFGKIDGYLQIYRQAIDGGWMSVYQTEVVKHNYNPVWNSFKISVQRLCNGDVDRPILVRCWDWNKNAEPDYAGELQTSLRELTAKESKIFHQKKNGIYTKKKCGTLTILQMEITRKISFLQYITGGMEIQLMIAIDFTDSNGDPRDTSSLHYSGPPTYESPYMRAIRSVGRVLEPYDTDGEIAAFGFGANINPNPQRCKDVSHCFNLSLNSKESKLIGIQGVLLAYSKCVKKVTLAGPSYFNEIIGSAATCAASVRNSSTEQNYVILFIVTDGVINDMEQTVDRIVAATHLPLSIIIVGVGYSNFSSMSVLDADIEPLRDSNGNLMKRDIVQFVPFKKYAEENIGALAKSVLEEIPAQIIGYMSSMNLSPLTSVYQSVHRNSSPDIYAGPSSLVLNSVKKQSFSSSMIIHQSMERKQSFEINRPSPLVVNSKRKCAKKSSLTPPPERKSTPKMFGVPSSFVLNSRKKHAKKLSPNEHPPERKSTPKMFGAPSSFVLNSRKKYTKNVSPISNNPTPKMFGTPSSFVLNSRKKYTKNVPPNNHLSERKSTSKIFGAPSSFVLNSRRTYTKNVPPTSNKKKKHPIKRKTLPEKNVKPPPLVMNFRKNHIKHKSMVSNNNRLISVKSNGTPKLYSDSPSLEIKFTKNHIKHKSMISNNNRPISVKSNGTPKLYSDSPSLEIKFTKKHTKNSSMGFFGYRPKKKATPPPGRPSSSSLKSGKKKLKKKPVKSAFSKYSSLKKTKKGMKDVRQRFAKTCSLTIADVTEMPYEHKEYESSVDAVCRKLKKPRSKVEQWLWHGTAKYIAQLIIKNGFDRSSNINGIYGKGTYFARDASFSAQRRYSAMDSDGYQYMLLCKVIVGDYVQATPHMKKTPLKKDGTEYDSLVNSLKKPTVYVVWREFTAAPLFLVKFK